MEILNDGVTRLAIDLNDSNQDRLSKAAEVEDANRELEAFAYSVSHDLRAPLRHISGFAAVLQERINDQIDAVSRNHLVTIINSAEKMGKMIEGLLAFSCLSRGALAKTTVDMDLLFAEVRKEVDLDYRSPAINWQIASLPSIQGDVAMLRQVVANLLDNAAKYSSTVEAPRIVVCAEQRVGEVVFRICDNGVGFDPKLNKKLFEVFQRLHRDDEFSGTGIGLASVRRILLRHGGWITGESVPGQETCFSFGLPHESASIDPRRLEEDLRCC